MKMMPSEVIVGLLSLLGTLIGSITAIMVSNKLTVYRIDQLESEVKKWNKVKERTTELEKEEGVILEKIRVINRRIADIEEAIKGGNNNA